jgi:hypothetical protein
VESLKDLKKQFSEFSEWLEIPEEITSSLFIRGFPEVSKPKKLAPSFPENLGDLGGENITQLMASFESWANYSRSLLGKVLTRKTVLDEIRKRLFTQITIQNKEKYGASDAKERALLDRRVQKLDKMILEDTIKADKTREYLTSYERYVSVLSRELTRLMGELNMPGGRRIYGGV